MAEGQHAAPTGKFWSLVGGLSGGAMGFIVANFPGAVAGAVAGNRLGAVRDAKGKSVYQVFQVRVALSFFSGLPRCAFMKGVLWCKGDCFRESVEGVGRAAVLATDLLSSWGSSKIWRRKMH